MEEGDKRAGRDERGLGQGEGDIKEIYSSMASRERMARGKRETRKGEK